jgi:methionyl aminopeptidase
MKAAGQIAADALHLAGKSIKPGVTTAELDKIIGRYITSKGAKPSFLGYNGFPGNACISLNSKVIHGIPSKSERLRDGDIVSIDVGAYKDGFHGDTAYTFACGRISDADRKLLDETKASLMVGISKAIVGGRIGDISAAIQEHCESFGFGVVKDYVGHGVGSKLHESPEIPNFGKANRGLRLVSGMTLAIEPMINLKGDGIRVLKDGWTVVTKSGSASAHFEHTICVTEDGPLILTLPSDGLQ